MNIQAAATMAQLQQKLDLISNNIANSETTGYKKNRGAFSSLLVREMNNLTSEENTVGRLTPDAIRTGVGARLGMIQMDTQKGVIHETGRNLDLALVNENQMLQVAIDSENGTETHFTRNGSLYLSENADGSLTLTTNNGHAVLSTNGTPIVIEQPFAEMKISNDGSVLLFDGSNQQIANVGQIGLVEAVRPEMLERVGQDYFKLPTNTEQLGFTGAEIITQVADQTDAIQTESLESSNVDIAEEMTELINTQRAYQFNARSISMGDQMNGLINQIR